MSKSQLLEARRNEFNAYMWNHVADQFQAKFEQRRKLSQEELDAIRSIGVALQNDDPSVFGKVLTELVKKDRDILLILLQLPGLTRNKILQDLKATVLSDNDVTVSSNPLTLVNKPAIWRHAVAYLKPRLEKILKPVIDLDDTARDRAMEVLNQGTWPGYIRQERAKRQGHEAEYRIATLLKNVGLPFAPEEKAENPLCSDAQINGVSFDLVAPNVALPVMLVKSTVHTANIGQYGESKDALEIR